MKCPMKSDFFPALNLLLEDHLEKFPRPYRACACIGRQGDKVKLTAQFTANASNWSHSVQARSLSQALVKLQQKLRSTQRLLQGDAALAGCGLGVTRSCGHHLCANASLCPNRVIDSGFVEAAAITK